MEGLPSELLELCRKTLLKCEQFTSSKRLRAFCSLSANLYFLKFQVIDADNPQELFELNLSIFIEKKHKNLGWIFPFFLTELRNAYDQNDMLWSQLEDLRIKVEAWRNQLQSEQQQTSQFKKLLNNQSQSEWRLYKSLLCIDFDEQEEAVIQVLDSPTYNKTAAFLVHGEEKFGQETLVTRLSQLPKLQNGRRIKIKVGGMDDISNLWNEVGKHLVDKNQSCWLSSTQIVEKIFEVLQTQHIIFIFSDFHRTYIGFLPELIQKFWQPLVERNNQRETYFAMFLVDNKGYVCRSGLSLAWQINHPELPRIPLSLPPASRFPARKLNKWVTIAVAAEVVPEDLCVETLLEESQGGVPDLVYQRICDYCGFSWEGGLARWLIQ